MLQNLYIKNYILISELNLELKNGFTTITGETGAGKSILLGALALLTGSRTDKNVLLDKNQKCIIEGFIELANYNLKPLFRKLDIDYEQTTIIRREINKQGKSRAFINDTPVNLSILKQIGEKIIDIHSQNNNLLLKDNKFYIQVIDTFCGNTNIITEYQNNFKLLRKTEKHLFELKRIHAKQKQDLDYFQFQFNQLNDANLNNSEQDTLEQEVNKLNNAEEIKTGLSKIHFELDENETSIISKIQELSDTYSNLNKLGINGNYASRLESVLIELKDIASDTNNLNNDVVFDPSKIEKINDRLNVIYDLQHKFSVSTIQELITIKNDLDNKLLLFQTNDEEFNTIKKEVEILIKKLSEQAEIISKNRKEVTSEIEKIIILKLVDLGIKNAQFKIDINNTENLTETGINKIEFLFSANKNIPVDLLAKSASGGELSRIMLSLKAMLATSNKLPTIIFDEIDTGVSGDIASKMAKIMNELAKQTQVLSITHLPQIAAAGKTHLVVYKTETQTVTQTSIKQIVEEERITEIAKMLSGKNISEAAMQNAKELLNTSFS